LSVAKPYILKIKFVLTELVANINFNNASEEK